MKLVQFISRHTAMTTLKSITLCAYEKGQSWLTNRVEKFANLKYDKLKPRILSRSALSYSNNNFGEEVDDQMCVRSRIHSIDVGDLGRNYDSYRNKISYGIFGIEILKN